MIHAPEFYRNFDAGFAEAGLPSVARMKGGPSRYVAATATGDVRLFFRANPKASAVPNQPGEFWPVVSRTDDSLISWYQFTRASDIADMQELQRRVCEKVAAQDEFESDLYRQMRDAGLPSLLHHVGSPPEPRFPHHALYYLDAEDARAWGNLLGSQMETWLNAYAANPETLDQHMWRLHWTD